MIMIRKQQRPRTADATSQDLERDLGSLVEGTRGALDAKLRVERPDRGPLAATAVIRVRGGQRLVAKAQAWSEEALSSELMERARAACRRWRDRMIHRRRRGAHRVA